MRSGHKLGVVFVVVSGCMATMGVVSSSCLASNTNVFTVKNGLLGGAPTGTGVLVTKLSSNPELLLGTNAATTELAVAVMNTDCKPGGLDPKLRLVAFNPATGKIAATLVDFTTVAPIFLGDDEIVMQASGEGRSGVEAANLDALIVFDFEPCVSTNNPTVPTRVEVTPLGFVRPAGTPNFNAPIEPDSGSLEITTDDPNNPVFSIPLAGEGTPLTATCNIDVNPLTIDFGTVDVGTNSTQTITIRNNGGSTCTISDLTENGSSAFDIFAPSVPFSIGPGSSVTLATRFTPGLIGGDSAVLGITSSDPNDPQQFVTLKANGVVQPSPCLLSISPLVLNFGSTEIGTNKSLNVTLTNSGGTTCTVDAITLVTNSAGFAFAPAAPIDVPPGTSTVVTVTFTPTDTNSVAGTLEIDSISPTNLTLITLSASGITAACHLDIEPTSINYGAVAVGGSRTQTVTIANVGITNCTITSLLGTNDVFTLVSPPTTPFDIAPGASTNLDIEFVPATGATTNGTLGIVSDNPVMTNNVALTGLGVVPVTDCSIVASPASLAFGDVGVGKTNVLKTTVSNVGLSNCVISSITFSGSNDFVLIAPPQPINLGPNGFIEVGVRYVPSGVGSDAGTVDIVSEDQSNTVISVAVSGNGVQPALSIGTNAMVFGSLPVGDQRTLTNLVTNIGTVPSTIHAISLSGSGDFSLDPIVPTSQFVLNPGEMVIVPVVYTPSGQGDDNGTLSVTSDDPNSPLQATLSGTGLQCHLVVTPTSIDFGTVALGRTNSVTVTISNTGNTNCMVESLDVLGSGRFSVVAPALPFVVGAGTNVDVSVRYAPKNVETVLIIGGNLKSSGKSITVSP